MIRKNFTGQRGELFLLSGRYHVTQVGSAKNKTPYWVVSVPVDIIGGHSGIFKVMDMPMLLAAFIRMADHGDQLALPQVRGTGDLPVEIHNTKPTR